MDQVGIILSQIDDVLRDLDTLMNSRSVFTEKELVPVHKLLKEMKAPIELALKISSGTKQTLMTAFRKKYFEITTRVDGLAVLSGTAAAKVLWNIQMDIGELQLALKKLQA